MVIFMESVTLFAYIKTLPLVFLAARPDVCISEVLDLKKPSLSASNMATKLTSGRSSPSLRRLIPIKMSNSPKRKERMT